MKKGRFKRIIKKSTEILGVLMTVMSFILAIVSWDDIGIAEVSTRIIAIIIICGTVIVCAGVYIRYFKNECTVWERASGKLKVCCLDIIQDSFSTKNTEKAIYVIPVNTAFDTIVDDVKQIDPLVAPKSLHGQFINQICAQGLTVSELDRRIEESLEEGGYVPAAVDTKIRGKCKRYEVGTIATIQGKNNCYYLLALTDYDEHNKAQSSEENIKKSIVRLIDYYDSNGQGLKLVVPLIGTGFARTSISHEDALRILISLFLLNATRLTGEIDIAVYIDDKNKMPDLF